MRYFFWVRHFLIISILLLPAFLRAQDRLQPKKDQNRKYGYADRSETMIIKARFDKAFSFAGDRAKVIIEGKWGLIDKSGDFIHKPKYSYIGWSDDGYFQWNKRNLSLTNTLVPAGNVFHESFQGYYAYLDDNKWGLLTESGKKLKNEWDSILHGEGAHFPVYRNSNGWTWIDLNNKYPEDLFFNEVHTLSNGLISIKESISENFIIYFPDGTRASEQSYRELGSLNDDFIKARIGSGWIQLNKKAVPVSDEEYEKIRYVHWNNTMQYLPKTPWQKSGSDLTPKGSIDYDIIYKIRKNFFVIERNDSLYISNTIDNTQVKINNGDSVISENEYFKILNKARDEFFLLDSTLGILCPLISDYKRTDSDAFIFIRGNNISDWKLWDLNTRKCITENLQTEFRQLKGGIAVLKVNDKAGVFDLNKGEWIVKPLFKSITYMNDSLLFAIDDDTCISSNLRDNISPCNYTAVKKINDSVFAFRNNSKKWFMTDSKTSEILGSGYNELYPVSANELKLKTSGGWKLYNLKSASFTLKNAYDSIGPLHSDHYVLRNQGKTGIANRNGSFSFKMSEYYESITPLYNHRWKVFRNGLAGIADRNGTLKISTQYEDFMPPVYDYIPFKFRGKWGLLDQKERFVIQPLNDSLEFLDENYIQVWKDGNTGLKNLDDQTLISIEFDEITKNSFGSFIVRKGDRLGFYDASAQQIRPVNFDEIRQLNNTYVALRKNDYWRLINVNGEFVSDKKFSEIYFVESRKEFYYKIFNEWVIKSLD